MRMLNRFRQTPYFFLSLIFHALLFSFLLFHMNDTVQPPIVNKGNKIVHAVAIDSQQVDALVKQLKNDQLQKQQAEIAKQKQIEEQMNQAKAKRLAEEKALEDLKHAREVEAQKAEQKKADDAKALAELKVQQAAEQKKLADLKQEQAIAAEKLKKAQEKAAADEKLKKQAEKAAADEKKKQQAEKEAKDAAAKLKQQKQDEAAAALQKQIAAKQAAIAKQRSEAINGVVDQYTGLILEAISQNWLVPAGTDPKLSCQLYIAVGAGGKVTNVQLVKSSGNALLDQSAIAAVYKASPLPMPSDPDAAAQFKQFSLTLRPEQVLDL